jgi:hypothetical protein
MTIKIQKRTRNDVTEPWSLWSDTADTAPFTNTDTVEYRVYEDLSIEDLTDGSLVNDEWTGTGIFDKLMYAVNKNIEGEWNKGRIQGTDYATVYLGSMQTVIAQSIQYLLQEAQMSDKLLSSEKQREVMGAQKDLYERQKQAFDDNKYQKVLEAQLNYNGMIFQDADTPDVLDVALENKVNDVFNRIVTTTGSRTDAVVQNEVTEMPEA